MNVIDSLTKAANVDPNTSAIKAIEELVKALNAGNYGAAPAGGHSLDIEPLDLAFDTITFDDRHIKKDDRYPHVCPRCKGPAYVGFSNVDCKAKC